MRSRVSSGAAPGRRTTSAPWGPTGFAGPSTAPEHRERRDRLREDCGAATVEFIIGIVLLCGLAFAGFTAFADARNAAASVQGACVASLACPEAGDSATVGNGSAAEGSGGGAAGSSINGSGGAASSNGSPVSNSFFGGALVDGAWGEAEGVWDSLWDPAGTAKALWELGRMTTQGSPLIYAGAALVPNPLYDENQAARAAKVGESVGELASDYVNKTPDRAAGRGVYEVGTIFMAPIKVLKIVKLSRVASVAAKTASVGADIVELMGDAGRAGKLAGRAATSVVSKLDPKLADEITAIAQSHGNLQCAETAAEITAALQRARQPGNYIRVQTRTPIVKGPEGRWDVIEGEVIGEGGHDAVDIGGIVYDNIHPNGIPRAEWLDNLKVRTPDGTLEPLGTTIQSGRGTLAEFPIPMPGASWAPRWYGASPERRTATHARFASTAAAS